MTGTEGQGLAVYNPNWTIGLGGFTIDQFPTQALGPNDAADSYAWWNADVFPNSQYAQCLMQALAAADAWIGVAVRCSPGGNFVFAYSDNVNAYFGKFVAGVETLFPASPLAPWAPGDVPRLESVGTLMTLKLNGGTIATATAADAALATGAGGVSGYGNLYSANNIRLWEAGSLGGGGSGGGPIAWLRA